MPIHPDFNAQERASFYRLINARRDVRHFRSDPVPASSLQRMLEAAHAAPSVGLMQPWNFLVVQSLETRLAIKESFLTINQREQNALQDSGRETLYQSLKLEGILEAPMNLAVTCDARRSGPFILGNGPWPETAPFSVCLAIENLWLAARVEGLGLGWVSLLDRSRVREILHLPDGIELIAYLCLGYPQKYSSIPMLEKVGWKRRASLSPLIFGDHWGQAYEPASADHEPTATLAQPTSTDWEQAAQRALDCKTKPPGSLGQLESLARRLAGLQRTITPRVDQQRLLVFAASHGIAAQGVSAYPSEVTYQMVRNFLRGGAAINVLTRHSGIELQVIDVGVIGQWTAEDLQSRHFFNQKVREGTRDFSQEPALSPEECAQAVSIGREHVRYAVEQGIQLVGIGEMGIGNTASASALLAALFELKAEEVTGRGTGLSEVQLRHKASVISGSMDYHRSHSAPRSALEWLQCVGGLEIAAMAGALLEAAGRNLPVVIDGFIATAAAAVAWELDPTCRRISFFSHRSHEQGHRLALEKLGVEPLLDLELRLGEGSGAALAMPLLAAAAKILSEMATFDSAGVSGRSPEKL